MKRLRTRLLWALAPAAVAATAAVAADLATVRANGVALELPRGWSQVRAASEPAGSDPRTLLVVGTDDVAPRRTACRVSSYRVPDDGAAVVVLGWRGVASTAIARGHGPLAHLPLRQEYFECFDGRGASVQLALARRAFQVNVLVGDRAPARVVTQALAVARSFDAAG